jgi:hypothetical protein
MMDTLSSQSRGIWLLTFFLFTACDNAPKPQPQNDAAPSQASAATVPIPAEPGAALASLLRNPLSVPPVAVQEGKDELGAPLTAYFYVLPPPLGRVHLDINKGHPEAWSFTLEAPLGAIGDGNLTLRLEARTTKDSRYYEVTKGPLAGAFVAQKKDARAFEMVSVPWIQSHELHDIGGWLCQEHRVPGAEPKRIVSLESACQAMVKDKLSYTKGLTFASALGPPHEAKTIASCKQTWQAWAEAETPWGRHRRTFLCTYEPRKDRLTVHIDAP